MDSEDSERGLKAPSFSTVSRRQPIDGINSFLFKSLFLLSRVFSVHSWSTWMCMSWFHSHTQQQGSLLQWRDRRPCFSRTCLCARGRESGLTLASINLQLFPLPSHEESIIYTWDVKGLSQVTLCEYLGRGKLRRWRSPRWEKKRGPSSHKITFVHLFYLSLHTVATCRDVMGANYMAGSTAK